jgi:uncharacterized protein YbgA (DUF1722 family)/uncharacterized protein YbbK (DUF523 family)
MIPDRFVESLKPYVDFISVCPEIEVGLGVPRDPIRIVKQTGDLKLIQPSTGRDVTREMETFAEDFLESAGEVDGFILKSRSPSCGFRDVKIYPQAGKCAPLSSKGRGVFGGAVGLIFEYKAIEDEARLSDFRIRENFLTKLFAMSDFRHAYESGSINDLIDFHSRNKYLLMAFSQKQLKVLGRIVADHKKGKTADVVQTYADEFIRVFMKQPRFTSYINALMHAFGHFSERITSDEKQYFLESLENYRQSRVPLSVPLSILRAFIVRFDDEYLKQQTLFDPFPAGLMSVTDSGKGRERR